MRVASRLGVWVVALVGLVGCVESAEKHCADGRTCPYNTECDDTHFTCVLPQQKTSCAGHADYDPCTYPGVTSGQCVDQVCFAAGCGNAKVDPGEACDNGNTVAGDGCSSDCRLLEVCGNGIVDLRLGE